MNNNKLIHCIHKNCVTNSLPEEERGHLFCLPKTINLREQWLKKMNRLDLLALPYNSLPKYRVCKLHFNNYDFFTPEKKKLIRGRIPLDINQHATPITPSVSLAFDETDLFESTPGIFVDENPNPKVEYIETSLRTFSPAFSEEDISVSPSTPLRLVDENPNPKVEYIETLPRASSRTFSGEEISARPTPRRLVDQQPNPQVDQPEIKNIKTSSGASSFEFSEEDIIVTPSPRRHSADAASELRKELGTLPVHDQQIDIELKTTIKRLQADNIQLQLKLEAHSRSQDERVKNLQQENAKLQSALSLAQAQLETALAAQESQRMVIDTLNVQLTTRLQE